MSLRLLFDGVVVGMDERKRWVEAIQTIGD